MAVNRTRRQSKSEKATRFLTKKSKELLELLNKGIFKNSNYYTLYFKKWRSETEYGLIKILGEDANEVKRFKDAMSSDNVTGTEMQLTKHRQRIMLTAAAEIDAILSSIKQHGIPEKQESAIPAKAFIAHVDKKRIDEGRAIELLKQALSEMPHLKELRYDDQEFILWFDKVRDIIQAGLDENDRQTFPSSRKVTITTSGALPSDDDFQRYYLIMLNHCETALRSIIQKHEILGETVPTSKVPSEAVYQSDTPYNAYKDIKEIIILATKKLTIVDMWVDSSVVSLLENVHHGVEVQVLTRHMQGDFKLAVQKFKEQREKARQGSLEVRQDKGDFHDRFIVADDNFFHLGASIKDAGTKVFAINEIEDPHNKSVLMENILKAWDAAEKVL